VRRIGDTKNAYIILMGKFKGSDCLEEHDIVGINARLYWNGS